MTVAQLIERLKLCDQEMPVSYIDHENEYIRVTELHEVLAYFSSDHNKLDRNEFGTMVVLT